jgi:hypothetical protein
VDDHRGVDDLPLLELHRPAEMVVQPHTRAEQHWHHRRLDLVEQVGAHALLRGMRAHERDGPPM